MPRSTWKKNLLSFEEISEEFPLHVLVWRNDTDSLTKKLSEKNDDIEKKDPRGRTPLMLAIVLNHLNCVNILLDQGANANTETNGWSAVQEATITGNKDLIKSIIERRNYQRNCNQFGGIPELLLKLKEAPDFYVEMNWEFNSWMPLVTRMCPSDTYRVYKQGSKVRIDSTLMGFEEYTWSRGNTSVIFQANDDFGTIIELDHNQGKVYYDRRSFIAPKDISQVKGGLETLKTRLSHPVVSSYVDIEKISFERSKTGLWGWRQDKTEVVNGYTCKVFSASNVELVTRTRVEHLSTEDKDKFRKNGNVWQNIFGFNNEEDEKRENSHGEMRDGDRSCTRKENLTNTSEEQYNKNISLQEYFTEGYNLHGRDIGVPKDMSIKIRKFKANLWLCKEYPLSLQEQIMPIIDLMATSSSNFAKLKDFIEMQFPAGFPVKIEIPLFHVMNAQISFNNIFATQNAVHGVTVIRDEERLMCDIDESLFEPPSHYTFIDLRKRSLVEDDDLLQYALQNNFIGYTSNVQSYPTGIRDSDHDPDLDRVNVWEAIRFGKVTPDSNSSDAEETEMQRTIEESLISSYGIAEHPRTESDPNTDLISFHNEDKDFLEALSLSLQEQNERDKNLKLEDEMLQRVLEISITDK
ncbi:hypothetical protein PGB90_000367 [Kerria lacca]